MTKIAVVFLLTLVFAITLAVAAMAVNIEIYPNTTIYGQGDRFRVEIWCGSYGYRWADCPAGKYVRWEGLPTYTGLKIKVTSMSGVASPSYFDDWVNTGWYKYGTIRRCYNFRY
jgi:hypothetical protein